MIEQFRRWFQYECDVMAQTFESLESVPAGHRESIEYRRALSILGHLAAARWIWLERLGAVPKSQRGLFPEGVELDVIQNDWQAVATVWKDWLARFDAGRMSESFEYTSLDGVRYTNTMEEVLTQLFSHGAYHRGQIAMLVKSSGGQPATTDFIYWSRRPI